eukprot:2829012-Pyramimonas_sp.AAC.1
MHIRSLADTSKLPQDCRINCIVENARHPFVRASAYGSGILRTARALDCPGTLSALSARGHEHSDPPVYSELSNGWSRRGSKSSLYGLLPRG